MKDRRHRPGRGKPINYFVAIVKNDLGDLAEWGFEKAFDGLRLVGYAINRIAGRRYR